jgi:hypothetical protein
MLATALVVTASATAGDERWVSKAGEGHALHAGDHALFIGDDGEVFDLADLADGETRVFGEGERQVTVTRNGDVATISRPAAGDDSKIDIECHLDSDVCQVTTFDDDSRRVMIMIEKTRECVDGDGDCDGVVSAFASGEAHAEVFMHHALDCGDDEEDCEATIKHLRLGDGPDQATIVIERSGGEGTAVEDVFVMRESGAGDVFVMKDDKVTLRCPEGDATMRVEAEEKQDVFLCPKHSVPLEAVTAEKRVHKIRVRTKDGAKEF